MGRYVSLSEYTAPLFKEEWQVGVDVVLAYTVATLPDDWSNIENIFVPRTRGAGDAPFDLRDDNKNDLSSVVEVGASRVRPKREEPRLNQRPAGSYWISTSRSHCRR